MSSTYLPVEPDWELCHSLKCEKHLNINGVNLCSCSSEDGRFTLQGTIKGSTPAKTMNKQRFSSKCHFMLEQLAVEYKKRDFI